MQKIFVEKNETVAEVIEKILSLPDDSVVLMIPNNSDFQKSVGNFHLLKKETEAAGKKIVIESVDEDVLAFAKANCLEAVHPFFKEEKGGRYFSDIRPRYAAQEEGVKHKKHEKGSHRLELEKGEEEEETAVAFRAKTRKKGIYLKVFSRAGAIIFVIIAVIGGGFFVASKYFGRVNISINFKKTPWHYEGKIQANKSLKKINVDSLSLPAEIFNLSKNSAQLFPASGREQVTEKAKGKIVIYNAYSSDAQPLVATTRFTTPDGKIFRLDAKVTVPGAAIKDGKIIPATTTASITAEKSGPDYNIGPVDRLAIPGFKGTAKYEKFYGSLKEPVSGGYIGEKAIPTDDNIVKAKERTTELLKSALQNDFLFKKPVGFTVLDGTSNFQIGKLTVNKNTDSSGNFSILGEASFEVITFRDQDLKSLLNSIKDKEYPNLSFNDLKIDFSDIKPDFKNDGLTFVLKVDSVLKPAFSADNFKKEIFGKKVEDVKSALIKVSDFEDAKISLWPFWLEIVPSNFGRINITTN